MNFHIFYVDFKMYFVRGRAV